MTILLILVTPALVYLYLLAGICIADLVTREDGPGAWLRFCVCVLIWPVLAIASAIGVARELRRRS